MVMVYCLLERKEDRETRFKSCSEGFCVYCTTAGLLRDMASGALNLQVKETVGEISFFLAESADYLNGLALVSLLDLFLNEF